MSKTNPLFLDERQAAGMAIDTERAPYPTLKTEEHVVLRVVSQQLFLSHSSVEWAYFNSKSGDNSGWKKIRERLMGKPVVMK